jgi:alpha-mannosidase
MVYWFKGDRKEEQLNRKDSFFAMSRKDIVLLAVKQSEDGKGLIVRLQEVGGKKARLKLKFHSFTILGAFSATLTEEIIKPLSVSKNEVEVTLGKFEITTVKIIIKKS